jgi:hypothetical protein
VQFQDELAGGIYLIRPALRSPDYVAGTSGWSVNQDGSAEFTDLTIRSSDGSDSTVTIANGEITITNGTGDVLTEIDSSGYRLYRPDGETVAEITLDAGQTLGGFYTRNFVSPEPTYAFLAGGEIIFGPVDNTSADIHGFLQYNIAPTASPPYTVQTLSTGAIDTVLDDEARIQLISERGRTPVAWIDGGSASVPADLRVTGALSVAGVDQGHGYVAHKSTTTATVSSAFEEIALTQTTARLPSGRAYRIRASALVRNDTANGGVRVRVRRGLTTAGATWLDTFTIATPLANTNTPFYHDEVVVNVSGSTITTGLVMTYQRVTAGTTALLNAGPGYSICFEVTDIGSADDFPDAPVIT